MADEQYGTHLEYCDRCDGRRQHLMQCCAKKNPIATSAIGLDEPTNGYIALGSGVEISRASGCFAPGLGILDQCPGNGHPIVRGHFIALRNGCGGGRRIADDQLAKFTQSLYVQSTRCTVRVVSKSLTRSCGANE